jgi:hypothetical protein
MQSALQLILAACALVVLAAGASAAPTIALDSPGSEIWDSDVAMNAAGVNVVAYVSQETVRYGVYVRSRGRAGGPFGAPVRVSKLTSTRPADVRVAVDGAGRAVVVWREGGDLRWSRRARLGGGWAPPGGIGLFGEARPGSPLLEITPGGVATAAWAQVGQSGWQVGWAVLDLDDWARGWSIETPRPVGAQPKLALDAAGDVGAIWVETPPNQLIGVVKAAVRPADGDWQPDVQLAPVGWGPDIAVAEGGAAIATWAVGDATGTTRVALKGPGPTWDAPTSFSPTDPESPFMGDRTVARDAPGNALLVWSEEGIRSLEDDKPQYLRASRRPAGSTTWGPVETVHIDTYEGPGGLRSAFQDVLASADGLGGYHVSWVGPPWDEVRTASAPGAVAFSPDPPPATPQLPAEGAMGVGSLALSAEAAGEALLGWSQWTASDREQVLVQGLPVGRCAPAREFNESKPGTVRLTVQQLRINQRIYSAAIRRAAAIERWLRPRLETRDLCGGGLGATVMGEGLAVGAPTSSRAVRVADPRPLVITPPAAKTGVTFALSVQQLTINQRVASKAVRLANALQARLDRGLSGGDIRPGAITADTLAATVGILSADPATVAPRTVTSVPPATDKDATFTLTARQLKINQRIGAAAVRRLNAVRSQLAQGFTGAELRARTITSANLDPGAVG